MDNELKLLIKQLKELIVDKNGDLTSESVLSVSRKIDHIMLKEMRKINIKKN